MHVDRHPGLIALSAVHSIYRRVEIPRLRDPEHAPVSSPQLRYAPTIFRTIAERDLLVLRREGNDLRRYLHMSTGNYNPSTARLYTDISLFTAREDVTSDALLLFNLLTGYAELPQLQRLIVAPFTLRQHVLQMIERE